MSDTEYKFINTKPISKEDKELAEAMGRVVGEITHGWLNAYSEVLKKVSSDLDTVTVIVSKADGRVVMLATNSEVAGMPRSVLEKALSLQDKSETKN